MIEFCHYYLLYNVVGPQSNFLDYSVHYPPCKILLFPKISSITMAYSSKDSICIPFNDSSSEEEMNISLESMESTMFEEATTPACNKDFQEFHFTKPKSERFSYAKRKRKFHGNRFPNVLGVSGSKSTKAFQSVPESQEISTSASRKLEFPYPKRQTTKSTILVSNTDDGTSVTTQKVTHIEGNLIISSNILQEALTQMAVCSSCQISKLKLYHRSGVRSGCAMYLIMRFEKCFVSKSFWSVSGKFKSKITVGENQLKKRNEMIFSSVLGGRLIGMGWQSLKFYHATLGIPQPCNAEIFIETLKTVAIAAEEIARCSMEKARNNLKSFLQIDPAASHQCSGFIRRKLPTKGWESWWRSQ